MPLNPEVAPDSPAARIQRLRWNLAAMQVSEQLIDEFEQTEAAAGSVAEVVQTLASEPAVAMAPAMAPAMASAQEPSAAPSTAPASEASTGGLVEQQSEAGDHGLEGQPTKLVKHKTSKGQLKRERISSKLGMGMGLLRADGLKEHQLMRALMKRPEARTDLDLTTLQLATSAVKFFNRLEEWQHKALCVPPRAQPPPMDS
jgi:hypothetical protein